MGILNATTVSPQDVGQAHGHALLDDEDVMFAFKTVRDFTVLTTWRILHINVQGFTGSKKSYLTIPYRSINAFSVETAGTFDLDAEIKIFLSGHPPIEFNIGRDADVKGLQTWLAKKLDR